MKELSIEQKAKRYDEALGMAKKLIENEETNVPVFYVNNIKDIFPELKKSEDEMIKKVLLDFLENELEKHGNEEWDGCFHTTDMIAWLEKQGEQPKKHDVCDNCDQQGSCVSPCPMKLVEKHGEQKPAEKIEPDKKFTPIESALKDLICDVDNSYTIEQVRRFLFEYGYKDKILNAAQEEMQKPADWNEEDENLLTDTEYLLRVVKMENRSDNEYQRAENCLAWLNSLRPQNRWKPSQSMINALSTAVKYGQTDDLEALSELLKQLKEL